MSTVTNYKSFIEFINSNEIYYNIYQSLNIKEFDTTLRDGLQNVKHTDFDNYTTEKKIKLYHKIINEYNPDFIETGSLVSDKYFPIFSDSLVIFSQTMNEKNFLLIPSSNKLNLAINNKCNNFCFISSVSESFQLKNINKTLRETKSEILSMTNKIMTNKLIDNPKIKIYLSCIDNCPFQGKISNDVIVDEIVYYYQICKPDLICLSDTCAFLTFDNFYWIINKCVESGVDCKKISLHLHVDKSKPNYIDELQKIFNYSLDIGIVNFDVGLLETGGCVMTLGSTNTKPNLSYELYYKLLFNYILLKTKK